MSATTERGDLASQPGPEHYRWPDYNDRRRWMSYWHQISETLRLGPHTCLVVGDGERTVSDALARAGVEVVTCDVDPSLRPRVVGDVRHPPFKDASFDVVLCAQVLEHLPFEDFTGCLGELRRITKRWAIVTLPQRGRSWEVVLWLPFLPRLHRSGKFPARTKHFFDEQGHHWEMGARNYPHSLVEDRTRSVFHIRRRFHVPENPFHRFYVLEAG